MGSSPAQPPPPLRRRRHLVSTMQALQSFSAFGVLALSRASSNCPEGARRSERSGFREQLCDMDSTPEAGSSRAGGHAAESLTSALDKDSLEEVFVR